MAKDVSPPDDEPEGDLESQLAASEAADPSQQDLTPPVSSGEKVTVVDQQVAETHPDLFHRFEKHGLKGLRDKYKDEDSLVEGVVNLNRLLGQRNEAAERWKWLEQNPEAAYKELHAKYGQQKEPAPKEPEKKAWQKIEWSDDWEGQILKDENGFAVEARPGSDPSIVNKYNNALRESQKFQRRLLTNPEEVLAPLLEERMKPVLEKVEQAEKRAAEIANQVDYRRREQEALEFIEREKGWIFNEGEMEKGISPEGVLFYQYQNDIFQKSKGGISEIEAANIAAERVYAKMQAEIAAASSDHSRTGSTKKPTSTRKAVTRQPVMNRRPADEGPEEWPEGQSLAQALEQSIKQYGQ